MLQASSENRNLEYDINKPVGHNRAPKKTVYQVPGYGHDLVDVFLEHKATTQTHFLTV